jgi:glycine/D-amino acid oxidase-like deaminating enzyme
LNELWPIFNKKLHNPQNLAEAAWIAADDYHPERHVFHYSLPQPGRIQDLLALVTRAHERPLDRSRPLWEVHVIEGLGRGRFALYCKVHHSLVDGVGAMGMMETLLTSSRTRRLDFSRVPPPVEKHDGHHSLFETLGDMTRGLLSQYRALPELSRLLAHMGADALQGKQDVMRLPFTAPRTIFNTQLESRRAIILGDLPLAGVKQIAREAGGTINDVLLAVCGGALRRYLSAQGALPKTSLVAGMPVSLKSAQDEVGNCRQFALLLKNEAQRMGVNFAFSTTVEKVDASDGMALSIAGEATPQRFDAVVLCAGVDSARLLRPLGLKIPLAAVHGYSVSASIREPLNAPRSAIMDERYKIAITRLGNRVRVAGSAEIGGAPDAKRASAIQTLYKVLHDWFPGAANHSNGIQIWKGARPMLPDGPPLLGASGIPGLWLNLGHGSSGWSLSCGSARAVADLIGGRAPEIDLEGLDMCRLKL